MPKASTDQTCWVRGEFLIQSLVFDNSFLIFFFSLTFITKRNLLLTKLGDSVNEVKAKNIITERFCDDQRYPIWVSNKTNINNHLNTYRFAITEGKKYLRTTDKIEGLDISVNHRMTIKLMCWQRTKSFE